MMVNVKTFASSLALLLFSNSLFAAQAQDNKEIPDKSPAAVISPNAMQAVSKARQLKQVKQAFDILEQLEPQTKQDHITLNEIPAPPFQEQKRAEAFAKMLREAGADSVELDQLGNVIALRKGTKGDKTIALAAHIDTVFPPEQDVKVKVEGEKLTAPGIGDNTRGMIVALTTLRAMVKAGIRTEANILFVGTLGEEGLGDLRGVKYLFKNKKYKIDSFIAIDGGKINRVVYAGIGSIRYRVTFAGSGGHSWGSFGNTNPHHALGKAMTHFTNAAATITSSGVKTSYNIGRIGGGTSVNSIPFESWMEVDMRSRSITKLNDMDRVLKASIYKALEEENKSKRRGEDITVKIEKVGDRPVAIGDPNSSLIQHVLAALKNEDIDGRLASSSTDSNIPLSIGIPAVTLSRGGSGGHSHAPAEWWENTDGPLAMRILLTVLIAEGGMGD